MLHIYGQNHEHDKVYIVGNKESLRKLRDAITNAIDFYHYPAITKGMTSDGEGYEIRIISNDTPWAGKYWQKLGLPYAGSSSQDIRDNAIWPWEEDKPCN